ncbi:MAG: pro-sigmaK processing inhibitor BofA family protein [Lachnospiraceae bacterium]|nr:pro-sigmaK processing inhibitor BofA family protein [Lachnospiraceae bacterium]MBQ9135649.1 pro-sigmaK processing inhibitor BofA family protein [Lachnospiraceae bacterium]
MENQTGILVVVAVCALVLLAVAMRKRAEWLMNFILRGVFGTLGIYFINMFMTNAGMVSSVGINLTTVLTTAILGFPGVFVLYGIHFFKTM